MSILSDIKQQTRALDDLAKLPQPLIMQMAQRKEILPEMVAPILARKAQLMEAVARTKAVQSAPQAMSQPSVLEGLMAKNSAIQAPPQMAQQMPQQMEGVAPAGSGQPPQFAGGGIVAFKEGDMVEDDDENNEFSQYQNYLNNIIETFSPKEDVGMAGLAALTKSKASAPDVQVALAVPSAKTYEMQKSSIAQKLPDQEKPEIKEVTKERVEKTEPNEPPKAKEKVTVKATPTKTPKRTPDPLNHPYAGLVAEDAKKYGNDPKIALKLLNNETGGVKNPETAVSPAGAVGIAQFMPKTAKQYGIDPTNPAQASDAMNRHVKHLMKQYGDPQLVAIAYNWGEGNTNRWLRGGADPRRLPKETQNYLDKFMTTALARGGEVQSYAQGGTITAENYKEKMSRVFGYDPHHGEAVQKYLHGGEVQHFDAGGLKLPSKPTSAAGNFFRSLGVDDAINAVREGYYQNREFENRISGAEDLYPGLFESMTPEERARRIKAGDILFKGPQTVQKMTPAQIEAANAKIKAVPLKPSAAPADPRSNVAPRRGPPEAPPEAVAEPSPQVSQATPQSMADVQSALNEPPPQPVVDQMGNVVSADPEYTNLLASLKKQSEDVAKQRKEDKAYAMIMAGLATIGGESPNALTNIAKGQAAGLGYLSDARKQSAAEDARILQTQGTVLRYKDANLLAKNAQKEREDYRKTLLELKELQMKQDKDSKDLERERKVEADAEKKRKNIEFGLQSFEKMHMADAEVQYKALMAEASKAVLPEEKSALEAKANAVLQDARLKFETNPIVKKQRKILYPEIDWDAYSGQSKPATSAVDTTGFKRVK